MGNERPIRLWPGVAIVAVQWLLRFALPAVYPDGMLVGILGGMAGGVAVVIWWLAFSRAPMAERVAAVLLMVVGLFGSWKATHVSITTGAQGMIYFLLAVPVLSLAFVLWAAVRHRMTPVPRFVTMAAAIFLSCGVWTLARTDGFSGNFDNELAWRWSPTAEDRLLAHVEAPPPVIAPVTPAPPPPAPEKRVEPKEEPPKPKSTRRWPAFRGEDRDGIVRGVRIRTDWAASPPVELWRRPIGPGWSSIAVDGDLIYTQEQRGPDEIVACYHIATGKPVWVHKDAARFWESNAGAGPRATPTLHEGRVYSLGATGIVNALDSQTGALIWSRKAAEETETKTPDWGFSGSPLVVDDQLVVAISGRLVAYDLATGKPRWTGKAAGTSYSSPRLVTFDGVRQILMVSAVGATGVAPADGTQLWRHEWKGYPIVQPAITADGDILVAVNESSGTRRLAVTHGQNGWQVEERWTSNGLKPYFNDFVVHKGHAYGFDGRLVGCIDLADGKRKWKGGRYGQGQMILLADQDLLLVLSEEGELALVQAATDGFTELARHPAIDGKTWNHPVLAGDVLLVRNGQEMAAFRLGLAASD